MTQIQPWQCADDPRNHPMAGAWLRTMQRALMKATEWVDQDPSAEPLWRDYRSKLKENLFDDIWESFPDARLEKLWLTKSDSIQRWYHTVHEYQLLFTAPAQLAEVYREKVEQALDFIVDVHEHGVDVNLPPLLTLADDYTVKQTLEHANCIISQRKKWIKVVSQLERYRIRVCNEIVEGADSESVQRALERGQRELQENKKQWILTLI